MAFSWRTSFMTSRGGSTRRMRRSPPRLNNESQRTDWERRVLAAVRWVARAIATTWPSEALIANMVALESLFVEGQNVRKKGKAIAEALTERVVLNQLTTDQQRDWLSDIYQRRNEAVHEGRQYADDLETDRLTDLAWWAVHWGLWHLNPLHARGRASPVRPSAKQWPIMTNELAG